MKRSDIRKHVIDTIGKMLVDKSWFQEEEDISLNALEMDEADFREFFTMLQSDYGITLPNQIKADISALSAHSLYGQLTLEGLVDLILVEKKRRTHH